jgi:serine O-acetyltransferase
MFENIRNDYRMYPHFMSPALWVMAVYRFGRWVESVRPDFVRKPLDKAYWILESLVSTLTTVHLPRRVTFGRNFHLIHPMSIIIHPSTVFGDDVGIMHEVTIGSRGSYTAPVIGNDVFIGAGAKILGEITIGNHVDIGANAVVLTDVPDHSLAAGVPAKIKRNHTRKPWRGPDQI